LAVPRDTRTSKLTVFSKSLNFGKEKKESHGTAPSTAARGTSHELPAVLLQRNVFSGLGDITIRAAKGITSSLSINMQLQAGPAPFSTLDLVM